MAMSRQELLKRYEQRQEREAAYKNNPIATRSVDQVIEQWYRDQRYATFKTVGDWVNANEAYLNVINDYNNKINNGEWLSTEDRKNYRKAIDAYIETANIIRSANNKYGSKYSDEDEQKWADTIASLNQGYADVDTFYNYFESDKVYADWMAQEKANENYKSQLENVDTEVGNQGYQTYLDDVEKARAAAAEAKANQMSANMGDGAPGIAIGGQFNAMVEHLREDQSHRRPKEDSWSPEQIARFGELYVTSPAAAYAFAEETNRRNDSAAEREKLEAIQKNATSSVGSGIGHTVGAIASAPFGLADFLNDLAYRSAGREITADGWVSPFEYSQAVTGGISTRLNEYGTLDESVPIFGGKGWGDVYGLGTSAVQSLASAYTLGSVGTLVSYFGQGAAAGVDDAISRGASADQALLYGAALGAFEGVAEMIGIEKLFKLGSSSTLKGLLKNIIKQSGVEGLEEGFTSILSNAADAIIMQDKSNFAYQIAAYRNLGYSEAHAKEKVFGDALSGILYDAIAGAASGAISGGVQTGLQTIDASRNAKKTYGDNIQDLLIKSAELGGNTALVDKLVDKYGKKGTLSGYDLYRLVETNDAAIKSGDKTAIANYLTKLGEGGNVGRVADVVLKKVTGEELTAKEESILAKSKYGNEVVDKIDANEIGTGNLASELSALEVPTDSVEQTAVSKSESTPDLNEATEYKALKSDVDLVKQIATEKVGNIEGWTEEVSSAMIKGYDERVSPTEYATAFQEAFNMGANNVPASKLVGVINSGVSERVAYTAYALGKQKNVGSGLKSVPKNGIIDTNTSEAKNESGESIHLHDGGKRDGSKDTQRQISRVEGGTGEAENRGENNRVADSEAARLVNEGREVKVSDLGILGGSSEQTVRVVDKASETSSMKEAREKAEARGLKVTFFVGDNLVIKDKNGKWISAMGYIKGKHVFVRGDHPLYTADQLMRHELGHDMIAKGEVDIDKVRERIKQILQTEEGIEEAAKHYEEAYRGSGYTADEIWEEMICDSLADMNIFSKTTSAESAELMSTAIPAIQQAVSESKTEATNPDAQVEGKASRYMSDEDYENFGWVRDKNVVSAGHWKSFTANFADAIERNYFFNKTPNGEFMVEAYNYYDTESVADVIVFAKGTIESPIITQIIRINSNDNQVIEDARLEIYALERRGVHSKAGGLLNIYTRANTRWISNVGGSSYQNASNNNQLGVKRSRSEIKANPVVKSEGNEDAGTVTVTYRNGDVETKPWGKASRELDTEYLSAVNRGDMETAQRMVDEAAKKAGYTYKGMHGTDADFNKFDYSYIGDDNKLGLGFYFTNNEKLQFKYNYEKTAYLKFENPLFDNNPILDDILRRESDLRESGLSQEETLKKIQSEFGYDGIIAEYNRRALVAFNPEQIKSADPVIYDDDGNVIPLSERFNPKNSDIRYSRELNLDYDENMEATKTLTNRDILVNALENVTKSQDELDKLREYKKNIEQLNKKSFVLGKMKEDIYELQRSLKVNGKKVSYATFEKQAESRVKSLGLSAKDIKYKKTDDTYSAYVGEREILSADRVKRTVEENAKLAELKEKAAKLERSINYYDSQLVRLEAMKPVRDLVQRERAKAYKKAAEKGREALRKNVEGRHKTAERHAIKALKDKFIKMMDHPTDKQYIPASLVLAMVDVCSLIDTDTDLYKADGSINKAQQKRNEQMERLLKLRDEYAALGKNPDPMYSGEFDQDILEYLDELRQDYTGKSLAEMTLVELQELRHTLKAIDETLMDARKLIGWGEADNVYDAGDRIIDDQRAITEKRRGKGENTTTAMLIDNSLSPLRNIKRMAGYKADSPLVKLFRDIELGVRNKNKFVMDAYKSFEPLTSRENAKKYEDAIFKPFGKEYIDKEGRKFRVSKMEMMQAIMSYNRELANDKLRHVSDGGFAFADIDLLNKGKLREAIDPKNAHTVNLGAMMAIEFQNALANDKWAQEYMKTAEQFFDVTAKDAVNKANMTLKHRIIATGSKYIPYEVDKDFVVREITSENDIQQTISGYGMLKDIKAGATQPLIITGLNNILERHIDQVGNIHGLAVPVRNFNKVWNVKSQDGSITVQKAIKRNFGERGAKVMIQAVKDVQGSRIRPEWDRVYNVVKGNIIGSTFMGNGSVVTKQVGSLFTATAKMRWRDPASMIANLIYTMANYKKIAAEVDAYTATAWVRRQGMSDAELHTLTTQARKKGLVRLINKLPAVINPTKWITGMDSLVALSLWTYAKADVAKQTGLSGEELYKAAAEYYDDIIENTQSMSDALHRPEIQKSGGIISETLGTFKTDLYQGAGLIADALGEYKANPTKENAGALARAVTGSVMSAVWGALMTSIFAMIRYKVNRYRDDDDEITAESWLKVQGSDLVGDLVGYIVPLFGGELYDVISAVIKGEQVESFDNMVLNAINDLISAFTGVANAVRDGEWMSEAATKKLVNSIGSAFGVPTANMIRLWDAIRLHAEDIANGEFLSFQAGKK